MESGITRDDWLKALHEAGCPEDEDDQAATTIQEFAAMFAINRQTAERRLQMLESKGLATRTRKRAMNSDGRTLRFVAYRRVTP